MKLQSKVFFSTLFTQTLPLFLSALLIFGNPLLTHARYLGAAFDNTNSPVTETKNNVKTGNFHYTISAL